MMRPVVCIVGRPNVGKSTLFNRIVRRRVAIVERTSGVTRDRRYFDTSWVGREFTLVDTGGLEPRSSSDELGSSVKRQVMLAINEAQVVVFLVDGQVGVCTGDLEIADTLRRSNTSFVLAVNKIDNPDHFRKGLKEAEFYSLGCGEPVLISALHGFNVDTLLDRIIDILPDTKGRLFAQKEGIRVAIVGRPNVGKSSILNRLLGEERVVVDSTPGTTRDDIDVRIRVHDTDFTLVDTAGIKRGRYIKEPLERYCILRTQKVIRKVDVSLIVCDATEGITNQDKRIINLISPAGCSGVICINKWDLIQDKGKGREESFRQSIREELSFLSYIPIIFTSASTGYGLDEVFDLVKVVVSEREKRIPTGFLNRVIRDSLLRYQPPSKGGKSLKVFYSTQVEDSPPQFAIFVNYPFLVNSRYLRYLEGVLREVFGFYGTPLRISIHERPQKKAKVSDEVFR